ncbi:MAG: hypothetical protein WC455_18955 [Dehalococcoidia bacterium]|jgi:hypothetical protein
MADLTLEISNSAWATATAYVANQYVSNDSRDYVCIAGHTSGVLTEPGTGVIWQNCWRQSEAKKTLMLARDNGIAMWKSYEVAQDGGNQDKPIWSQTDWSGGFGQGDFADPSRYSVGYCVDCSTPGKFFLGPHVETGTIHGGGDLSAGASAFATFNGELYMVTTYGQVYKWSTTNSHWDSVYAGVGSDVGRVNLCVHNGYLYAAQGESTAYVYSSDGASWTAVSGYYAKYFVSAPPYAGNTPVLWRCSADNLISSSADPTDGAEWESSIYVGDSSSDINNLFLHQGQLFIGKTDGLYHYDSDGVVHKLLSNSRDYQLTSTYYGEVCTLKGATYFNMGKHIGELTTYNSFDIITPILSADDIDMEEYFCLGLASDGTNLYAALYDTVTVVTHIYKGHEVSDSEGNTKWAWDHLAYVASVARPLFYCEALQSGSWYHPKLWMGYTGTGLRYLKISQNPTASSFYYADSPSFTSLSGYLETGWIDLGYRDWYKIVDSVLVECRGTMGTVAVAYQADESGSYTTIGTYSATTSGTKDYVATAPFAAKKFKLKITLTGATTASTPIVKYVAVYGSVRPNRVTLMDFTITAEEGHSASSKGLRDFLIHCRDSTGLHTLTDRFGASHYVRILPGYPTETEYLDSSRKQPALGLRVICEKVDWSA